MRGRYRLVMHAYPPSYRHSHGDEIRDTAVALGGGHWSPRQATSLGVGGLRTRALLASDTGPRALWAAGLRLAILLLFLRVLASMVAYRLGATGSITEISGLSLTSLYAAAVAALAFTTRWPTAVVLTAILIATAVITAGQPGMATSYATVGVLGVAAWWLALATDGKRAASPTTVLVLLGVGVGPWAVMNDPALFFAAASTGGLLIVGLALVAIDPRPLIASAATMMFSAATLIPASVTETDPLTLAYVTAPALVPLAVLVTASRYAVNRLHRLSD